MKINREQAGHPVASGDPEGPGAMGIHLKRIYEQPAAGDGYRVLVERLWPRGLSKERASVDLWMKEVAPSPELRSWYHHDVARWQEFQERYRAELRQNTELVQQLAEKGRDGTLTLVYAARDEQHNSARVLKEFLEHGKA
jgi:uncharacterized protein YeaO (DUF488 family)